MAFDLHFNLAQRSVYKVARFQDQYEKQDYVSFEYGDPLCRALYAGYSGALRMDLRKELAIALDSARWQCYQRWLKGNSSEETGPSLGAA